MTLLNILTVFSAAFLKFIHQNNAFYSRFSYSSIKSRGKPCPAPTVLYYTSKDHISSLGPGIIMHSYIQLMSHMNPYIFQIHCFSGSPYTWIHWYATIMEHSWIAYIFYIKALWRRYWVDCKLGEDKVGWKSRVEIFSHVQVLFSMQKETFLLPLPAKRGKLKIFDAEIILIHFHIFFSLLMTFKLLNFSWTSMHCTLKTQCM